MCFRFAQVDDKLVLKKAGFSVARKAFLFCNVIVIKFLVAAAMIVIGGVFVASSKGNEDLLLNCLAVIFIIEVDELVYLTLVPSWAKSLLQELPPFETHELGRTANIVVHS